MAVNTGSENWSRQAKLATESMRRLDCAYARANANLLDGLRLRCKIVGRAKDHLWAAQREARDAGFVPLELAAGDALHFIEHQDCLGGLRQRMKSHRVKSPIALERLYTVAPSEAD